MSWYRSTLAAAAASTRYAASGGTLTYGDSPATTAFRLQVSSDSGQSTEGRAANPIIANRAFG